MVNVSEGLKPPTRNMLNPAISNSDQFAPTSGVAARPAQSPHSPFGVRSLGCESAREVTKLLHRCLLPSIKRKNIGHY